MSRVNSIDMDQNYDNVLSYIMDEDVKYTEHDENNAFESPDEAIEEILSMFDGTYNIAIEELNDLETTKMIQTQKEYERFGTFKCGHRLFVLITKVRILIFNALFLFCGLIIAEYVIKHKNHNLYLRSWFYTIYFSFLIFCIPLTTLFVFLIMKLLQTFITNSWKVFYIKDIHNRLFLTILCILWFIILYIFGGIVDYDYNQNIFKLVQCLSISSALFLISYILIRSIALNSYFHTFRQRARKLKAFVTFIQIMLDITPKQTVFTMPLMNFLIDFPTFSQRKQAWKENIKHISFKFCSNNIVLTEKEEHEIIKLANTEYEDKNNELILSAMTDLLNSELYSIDIENSSSLNTKLISRKKLNRLSMLISYLIIVRLNQVKRDKILTKDKYKTVTLRAYTNKILGAGLDDTNRDSFVSKWNKMTHVTNFSAAKLAIAQVKRNQDINEHCFIQSFKEYKMANKDLLIKLGIMAWKKFSDKDSDILNAEVLNMNIRKIINDLLELKQSIDSYIVIISNLQRMIDVITPILLLFVYLYIFNLDFQQTLTLYVSSVGIIGFFGSSYFSSVFASISFIIALNPFLVGDIIWINNDFYKIREISLISCVFENLRTGWNHTFQNKALGSSDDPIINLSRSGTMTYRFVLYFQCNVDNDTLYEFSVECGEEIERVRENELLMLEYGNKCDENGNKRKRCSFCTFSELKNIDFESVIFKSVALDEYGRKTVWIEMKYDQYSWNVRTLCFNSITKIANKEPFKQYLCPNVPIRMEIPKSINTETLLSYHE